MSLVLALFMGIQQQSENVHCYDVFCIDLVNDSVFCIDLVNDSVFCIDLVNDSVFCIGLIDAYFMSFI